MSSQCGKGALRIIWSGSYTQLHNISSESLCCLVSCDIRHAVEVMHRDGDR